MGIFKKLKEFFASNDEAEKGEETQPQAIEPGNREYSHDICQICGKEIGTDKWTKKEGIYMHKRCFRQQKRIAMKAFGASQ